MSKHRRAAKIDANQNDIVDGLRKIPGVTVEPNHDDILVGFRGRTYWFEIKNSSCANKNGVVFESKKKKSQKKLEESWKGHYQIVTSIDEILIILGIG
jgi:hypothetical protein